MDTLAKEYRPTVILPTVEPYLFARKGRLLSVQTNTKTSQLINKALLYYNFMSKPIWLTYAILVIKHYLLQVTRENHVVVEDSCNIYIYILLMENASLHPVLVLLPPLQGVLIILATCWTCILLFWGRSVSSSPKQRLKIPSNVAIRSM